MQPSPLSCYELTRESRDRGLEKLQRPGNWYCPVGFLACWLHSLEPRQPTRILEVTNFGHDLILFPTSVNMLLFACFILHLSGITGDSHAGGCANVELPLEISRSLP